MSNRTIRPVQPPPMAPARLPLLGHVIALVYDPFAFLKKLHAHGKLVQIRIGLHTAIVICDPELTWQFLHDDRTFDKGGPVYDRAREFIGDGVASCQHDHHRRQRRLIQPAFHDTRLPGYASTMAKQVSSLTDSWTDGQILDVPAQMWTFAARSLMRTMFSSELSDRTLKSALDDLTTVLTGSQKRMLMPDPLNRLPTPANRRYHHARTRLRQTLSDVISEHRNAVGGSDLLSALPVARGDDAARDRYLTVAELSDNIVAFFSAGTESAGNTLSWALHLLDRHQHIQQRLYNEMDAVLGGAPASFEHLSELDLAGRIIAETLRLYPPGWIFTRIAVTDTELGGYTIPAGSTLVYSPYLIHHREDLYPHPEQFDPDRWIAAHRPPPISNTYIAFGSGARKCIGEHYATVETTLALAVITSRWHLTSTSHQRVRPALASTLRPRKLWLRATLRSSAAQSL